MEDEPDYSGSVMVALLPITTDWCRIAHPHLTVVYAGKVDDHPSIAFNELAKDAASLATLTKPFTLETRGLEIFGEGTDDNPHVEVFTLRNKPELMALRNFFESWNASKHPFNPHVTVGPRGSYNGMRPPIIAFDRLQVAWGKDYITFNLRNH